MQTTHAKAIKYLGIATVVLAGLTLLGCLIGMVGISALGAYAQSGYPVAGYGYGHHGMMSASYADVAGVVVAIGVANALLFWKLACAVVALIAGIMALRLKEPTAHSLRTVFIWALVAAICSLLAGSFITMALLIIIAVFAEMDRKALEGGTPAQSTAAPAAAATAAPANPAYAASYGDDIQPVVVPVVPVAPVNQQAGPAVAENEAIADEAAVAAAVTADEAAAVIDTAEAQAAVDEAVAVAAAEDVAADAAADVVAADASVEAVVVAPIADAAVAAEAAEVTTDDAGDVVAIETVEAEPAADVAADVAAEAAAVAEDAHIAEEGQAAADFYQGNAEAVADANKPSAEAEFKVETTAPDKMENEGEAEELAADKAMTKEQDLPEQL